MFTVNKNPTSKDLRNFGWAMLAGFGVIGALLWVAAWQSTEGASLFAWSGSGREIAGVLLLGLGATLLLISRLSAPLSKKLYIGWMSATVPVGIVMSTVLLSVLFFALLPLFAVVVRLSDPMRRKRSHAKTYWEPYRSHEPTLARASRPF